MLLKSISRAALFLVPFLFFLWNDTHARTIVLDGRLDSSIRVAQQMIFRIERPLSKLDFRFAIPAAFSNRAMRQHVDNLKIDVAPDPAKVDDETDAYGNHFKRITWKNLRTDAKVRVAFVARVEVTLSAMESTAPFPVKSMPQKELVYLQATALVQSDSPEIQSLAKGLTANAATLQEAVTAISNYVADEIRYSYNPPQFDALYTLKTKTGNCQNFAHLSMALLRAVGIPSRIVGGISLKQSWKIPVSQRDTLVQSMGQGGHAWMEVFFPDLGWLSYDPQQSKRFTSSRHIKQTHGLDSRDINDSWGASPYLPKYDELVDALFLKDEVSLKSAYSEASPRSYLFSNNLLSRAEVGQPAAQKPPIPVEVPKPPPPPNAPPSAVLPRAVEFGNTAFPVLVDVYEVVGGKGVKILDKETAEYVTSHYVYAQAFEAEEPISVDMISLAVRRFGGDGSVFVDLVSDDNGRPALVGARSQPVFLENIARKAGYYWVDFSFPSDDAPKLSKGRHWIVLRHSGEVIMNWFYIPGNPYGDSDDTRSTLKGHKWQDIQNYDFVFRVRAFR